MKKFDLVMNLATIFSFIIVVAILFTRCSRMGINTPSEAVETSQPIIQWTRHPPIMNSFASYAEYIPKLDLVRLVPDPYEVFTEPFEYTCLNDEGNRYSFQIDGLSDEDFDLYILACHSDGWEGNVRDLDGATYQLDLLREYGDRMTVSVRRLK